MDIRGIEVVSWDVDGTLYDMRVLRRRLIALLLERLGPRDALRTLRELDGLRRLRAHMKRQRPRCDEASPAPCVLPVGREALRELEKRWYGEAIGRVGLREGVKELMDLFASRGLRQVVLSDYVSEFKLERLGLDPARFHRIYSGEGLGHLKPSAGLYRAVIADLGIEADRLLHVGDRLDYDAAPAALVGYRVVILGHHVRSPGEWLASLRNG